MDGSAINWNAVNAAATFAAVVVALAFGLRESWSAYQQRLAKQDHALATIVPLLADTESSLNVAIQEISAALLPNAEAKAVADAWRKSCGALSAVTDIFKKSMAIRSDLPLDCAVAIAIAEGVSAAIVSRISPLVVPATLEKGDDVYEAMRRMLTSHLPIVRQLRGDLLVASEIGRPVVERFRRRLDDLKKQYDLGRYERD